MRTKQRFIALMLALVLMLNVTPVSGAETVSVNSTIENYMGARYIALLLGETKGLEGCSVVGIV